MTPRRLRAYPIILLLGVVVFWSTTYLILLRNGYPFAKRLGRDFLAFYTAGRFYWDGHAALLYDFSAQQAFQSHLVGLPYFARLTPFLSPPFIAPFYALFAWDNYAAGLLAWWLVGLLTLAGSFWLLRQALESSELPPLRKLIFGSLLFYPTIAWLIYGQATHLALVIYVAVFVLLRRQRDGVAGLVLGFLLFKPQLMLGFGIVLLINGRWRALLGLALSLLVWVTVSLAVTPTALSDYITVVPRLFELVESGPTWGNQSLFAFSVLLFSQIWPAAVVWTTGALTLMVLVLIWLAWRHCPWQPATRSWDLTMAACMALGLPLSPHLYLYDLMLLLPPLVIVWRHHSHGANNRALDGGPLLAATGWLYLATFFASYFALAQQALAASIGLPSIALQLTVPVIVVWGLEVIRRARKAEVTHDSVIGVPASASFAYAAHATDAQPQH